MRKMFDPEDYVILDMFSTWSREDTITRLAYAAAYFTKPEYKCRACRIRDKLGEWDDSQWESFHRKELQALEVIIRDAPYPFPKYRVSDLKEADAGQKWKEILEHAKKPCRHKAPGWFAAKISVIQQDGIRPHRWPCFPEKGFAGRPVKKNRRLPHQERSENDLRKA